MKRIIMLFLAAGFLLGNAAGAGAVDFKTTGSWDMYFNFGQTTFYKSPHDGRNLGVAPDVFEPDTRIRLQLDAVVSENLSGTLQFEIGTTQWGQALGQAGNSAGGALGADGVNVEIKSAFIDWLVPDTDLRLRMGIQGVALPNTAGGSAVLDDDVAAVVASYQFNDHIGLTAMWARPFNDNYERGMGGSRNPGSYLDNMDLAMLSMPVSFDGFSLTPWAMLGFAGDNMARSQISEGGFGDSSIYISRGILPVDAAQGRAGDNMRFNRGYSTMFWVGLPVKIDAFDPFNFEFDVNYGYNTGWGRYDDARAMRSWHVGVDENGEQGVFGDPRRNSTEREGWLIKALAEYKFDWGTPGLFAWYASGDDGDTGNGSERMPTVAPGANFTSFGLAGYDGDYSSMLIGEAVDTTYTGTWGIGAQISDLSFIEDLSHTVRVAYWRGTNDPAMAAALSDPLMRRSYLNTAWNQTSNIGGLYLTQNDYLIEFNMDSRYRIYENLEAVVELGYIVNGVDKSTWKWTNNQKEDAWKCAMNFRYSF